MHVLLDCKNKNVTATLECDVFIPSPPRRWAHQQRQPAHIISYGCHKFSGAQIQTREQTQEQTRCFQDLWDKTKKETWCNDNIQRVHAAARYKKLEFKQFAATFRRLNVILRHWISQENNKRIKMSPLIEKKKKIYQKFS